MFISGYNDVFQERNLILATFLNPTFKGRFLKDEMLLKKMLFEDFRQSMKSQLSKEKKFVKF